MTRSTTISTADSVPALLDELRRHADQPAVVDGAQTVSYGDLVDRVETMAAAFLADGVTRGERVAIWAPNRLEFVIAMLGAQAIGAAVVPLNTRYTGPEAAEILARCRASVLIAADGFLGRSLSAMLIAAAAERGDAGPAVRGLPDLRTMITIDPADQPGLPSLDDFLARGGAVSMPDLRSAMAAVSSADVMDIIYTSGTTGIPKGVMSSHRQTMQVARAWAHGAELGSDDRYAIVNPFFHSFGYKAGIMPCLLTGATVYPLATLDTDQLLSLIHTARITVLPGVPTVFTSLLDHPLLAQFDTSSLRFATCGATAAPETLFHDMSRVLGFARVAQAYGLTECVVATMSRHGELLEHAAANAGPAVEGLQIKIVDSTGAAVGQDVDGEILLKGETVMLGYFEDAAATDAAIDAAGWLHTGDVGRLDEHGCLKITDRLKDMFIVGGFNVYPAEVENALRRHPAVNESAVVGMPDERLGTVGWAYVAVRRDAERPSPEELEAFCRERLANFKVPRKVIFVDDFPRNGAGKILKSELRAAADQAQQ